MYTVEAKGKNEFKREMNGLWALGSVASRGGCSYKGSTGKAKGTQRQGRSQVSLMPLERLFLGHSAPSLVMWTSPRTAEEMERKKEERKGREGGERPQSHRSWQKDQGAAFS